MADEMLVLKDLRKTFNPGTVMRKMALAGVDLTLNKGDFITVIGGNGAGKSTMLNAIAGTFQIDNGTITLGEIRQFVNIDSLLELNGVFGGGLLVTAFLGAIYFFICKYFMENKLNLN